jgi:hypothetical protein
MFLCVFEKIFQTLPGQGWRVLIDWSQDRFDEEDDYPAATLEPVIAWVTASIQRKRKRDGYKYEEVIIAPLVRDPSGDELLLMDSHADSSPKFVYVSPGEELSQQHFHQLRGGGYAKGVTIQ